jgi:hypothetical protein
MNRVSLVCTVHDEAGHANVAELCAILESIQPEVIFLEVPPDAFDDLYGNRSRQNLESIAVRKYREDHQIKLVPVDLPTPDRGFFESHDQLLNTVRDMSFRYRQLIQSEIYHVNVLEFSYLNGEDYCKLWTKIDQEISNAVKRIGDATFIECWALWNETHVRRENAMMENIPIRRL